MSLSERVRPNIEAAPWVIDEIKELEEMLSVEVDNATNKRIKELEDRNKLLSQDNINLRKFIVDSRNKLSDFITNDLEGK